MWIAGGVDKGNNYELLEALVVNKVKALICLGTENAPLLDAFKGVVPQVMEVQTMTAAVDAAMECANYGDIVLLSPACASFDLFKNYQDRGDQFKQVVVNKKKVRTNKVLV